MRYKTKQRIVYTILGLLLAYFLGAGVGYNTAVDQVFDRISTCEQQGGTPFVLNHKVNCIY